MQVSHIGLDLSPLHLEVVEVLEHGVILHCLRNRTQDLVEVLQAVIEYVLLVVDIHYLQLLPGLLEDDGVIVVLYHHEELVLILVWERGFWVLFQALCKLNERMREVFSFLEQLVYVGQHIIIIVSSNTTFL